MSDVKWIKLSTTMFDDEKIKLIEQMPDADALLVIWIKMLSQAGKTNASGYIFLSENIPYTDEMLSAIFNRPLNTIRLALKTFQQFGMIEILDNNFILIENWGKHQSLDGLEKVRQQTRERVARHREKQKLVTNNVTLQGNDNVTDKERELELELELEKEKEKEVEKEKERSKDVIPYQEIVSYLNDKAGKNYKHTTKKTRDLIKARHNEDFTLQDFKKVIDIKCSQWANDQKMSLYLRPETLFGTKFEGYLNERGPGNGKTAAANKLDEEYQLGF